MKTTPTRLLIIDDHDAVREALEARLRADAQVEIVGCTGCWKTGLREAVRLKPAVVLLELKRSDMQGLEALRSLTRECPHTSVVVLTSYPDAEEQAEALRIGAARYLLKEIDTPQLVCEIQAFARPQATI
ncbi:MAG: response regulator transcription factor [Chloroflexi bacterium]|nr:response regulator transcription factor [Chloroflexota bacterium]